MKTILIESFLVIGSIALWLVVLPVAALLSPILLLFRRGGGSRPGRGRLVSRGRLAPLPA